MSILDSLDFVLLATIFVFTFMGSACRDSFDIVKGNIHKINIPRVFLGSISGGMLMLAICNRIGSLVSVEFFIFLCFVSGVGGFETFEQLKKINMIDIAKKYSNGVLEDSNKENKDKN